MNPEEKANDLMNKFSNSDALEAFAPYTAAKECALIVVDEILNNDCAVLDPNLDESIIIERGYWKEVKEVIKKL